MLRHPFRAGQMSFERTLCAIMLKLWVDAEDKFCYFTPICPFRVGVEQPQIGYNVLLVVRRKHGIRGRHIGNVGISRRFFHACVTVRMILNVGPTDRLRGLTLAPFQFMRLA